MKPILSPDSTPERPTVPGGVVTVGGVPHSTLTWDWRISIDDEGKLVSEGQIDTSGLTFQCDGQAGPIQRPVIERHLKRLDPDRTQLQLLMTYTFAGDYPANAATLAHKSCHWEGDLKFTINGQIVPKKMTTRTILVPLSPGEELPQALR